ncbi:MAG: zinc ribbon domain-containing protein, partial [Deltaproteobacteria bacterium]|nr:zinc ribbon domain-containing protein [Deltaproteobacteria bacterium]
PTPISAACHLVDPRPQLFDLFMHDPERCCWRHTASDGARRGRTQKHTWAFRGQVRCAHCGCLYTAERQKWHVYWHCTGARGRCGEPWVREEELARQFGEALGQIRFGKPVLEWVSRALRESHADERSSPRASFDACARRSNGSMPRSIECTTTASTAGSARPSTTDGPRSSSRSALSCRRALPDTSAQAARTSKRESGFSNSPTGLWSCTSAKMCSNKAS